VIRPLVWLHFSQQGWNNRSVDKPHIPVFFIILASSEMAFLGDLMNYLILSIVYVDYE